MAWGRRGDSPLAPDALELGEDAGARRARVDVFVDDVLVYRGVLKRAPEAARPDRALHERAAGRRKREARIYNDVEEWCLFIDEGSVVVEFRTSGRGRRCMAMFFVFCLLSGHVWPTLAVTRARDLSRFIST